MPRFVILAHDWPSPHFDLLMECGEVLRSWRLLAEPRAGVTVPAVAAAAHRRLYLDYEGEVSGGRGSVARYLAGEFDGDVSGAAWAVTLTAATGEVSVGTMTPDGFRREICESPRKSGAAGRSPVGGG